MQYQRYRDWTEHQVLLDADEFITKYELHDLRDILRKGALLAHDPTNASYAEGLTREPPILANTIAARPSSIQRVLQCVLFVVAAGACGMMAPGYLIDEYDPDSIQWIYVMPYLAGCIFTALLSRFLTSHKIMLAFGVIGLIRPLVEALCLGYYSRMQVFVYKSSFIGLGAVQTCTAPIYLAEISEPWLRNYLISAWIAIVSMISTLGSRLESTTPLTLVSPLLFLATMMTSWESPYPLISRGQMRHAYRSLRSLRPSDLAAARDLFRIHHHLEINGQGVRQRISSWRPLCSIQTCRALLRLFVFLLAFVLMRFQYDSQVGMLVQMTLDQRLFSFPFALIFIFFVMRAMKKFGLRSVFVGTILLDLVTIWVLNLRNMWDVLGSEPAGLVPQVMWKTALVTMSVGSFSPEHREFGVSVMSLFFYGSILLVELLAKAHVYSISNRLFGVLDVAALILVTMFTIDISAFSLEEIQTKVAMPLDKVASYRVRVELPYLFNRYCLRRDVELVPLDEYHPCFDEIALGEA
ncbi:uncharacterized protein LDX57_012226 [Aspergillus melleus]|uniref:uncharacterized protein n=1 Tax=Aspergillus melleus TaxID=138277 RepID=UPI001E8E710C|nr:uncharacterized protein LDX57_012226 [Aspergillus melleus]KAH8434583.1 hypothetical protein LDX57_012226 [Aspergillus melleus]